MLMIAGPMGHWLCTFDPRHVSTVTQVTCLPQNREEGEVVMSLWQRHVNDELRCCSSGHFQQDIYKVGTLSSLPQMSTSTVQSNSLARAETSR